MGGRYLNFGEIMLANSVLRRSSREYHRAWNLSPAPGARVYAGRYFVALDEEIREFKEILGWAIDLYDLYVAFEDGAIARLHREEGGSGWPTHEAAEADLLEAIAGARAEVREERWLAHRERRWRPHLGKLEVGQLCTREEAERLAAELCA